MMCRHCGHHRVNRPRGLCWSCYYKPGVRQRYPSTSKFAHRGIGNGNGRASLPTEPTCARPGSPEKVTVLEQRARHRQALWHPQDAPMDPESTPQIANSKPENNEPRMKHGLNTDSLPCSVRVASVAANSDFGFRASNFLLGVA
jgi:hypothetical protein